MIARLSFERIRRGGALSPPGGAAQRADMESAPTRALVGQADPGLPYNERPCVGTGVPDGPYVILNF